MAWLDSLRQTQLRDYRFEIWNVIKLQEFIYKSIIMI